MKSSSRRSEPPGAGRRRAAARADDDGSGSGGSGSAASGGDSLALLVKPRAPRDRVVGLQDDRLVLQLQAPPVDGAANTALLRFLAARLGVPRSRIALVRGAASRHKWIRVEGCTAAELRQRLLAGQ